MMERLDADVRAALRHAGVPDASRITALVEAWPAAVGAAIARAAWPLRLARDGTLHVACASSTWAFELGRMAPELLAALAARTGDGAPSALRFAPGPLPSPGADESGGAGGGPGAPTPDEEALAASLTASATDPELRALVARAAAASLAAARHNRRF